MKTHGQTHMDIFPHLTERQVFMLRVGSPAYQMIHPFNKDSMSSATHGTYKAVVTPSIRKKNASMPHHLGMLPLYRGKNGGSI